MSVNDVDGAIQREAARDPLCRRALLVDAMLALTNGDVEGAKAALKSYVTATIGWSGLEKATGIHRKSLMRMLAPGRGNPMLQNFASILLALEIHTGVRFKRSGRRLRPS